LRIPVPVPLLAIETSCDETAAAVLGDGYRILSNVVYSQVAEHEPFGGVVPEIASRRHLEVLPGVVRKALDGAGVRPAAVAVTRGPGLIGSLMVGVSFAKAFAWSRGIPAFAVHHISGHIHAALLERPDWSPPFLALVVSGGHTELVRVPAWGVYERLGRTIDDAAGEAFDKAAKMLRLGFPGGPALAAAAAQAGGARVRIAGRLMPSSDDFSFSGLKTALRRLVGGRAEIEEGEISVLAASFQDAIVETLCEKTIRTLERTGVKRLVLTGGVAANLCLREELGRRVAEAGVEFATPSPGYCTDNAAMIAASALAYPREPMPLDGSAAAGWPLE
jgi:N6-L-threonylcarbamoyladenine synthase